MSDDYEDEYADIFDPEQPFLEGLKKEESSHSSKWDYQAKIVHNALKFIDRLESGTIHVATGGGKTRIANDLIYKLKKNNPDIKVLWVTKDWRLLYQAALDYFSRYEDPDLEYEISRYSGKSNELSFLPDSKESWKESEYIFNQIYTTSSVLINKSNIDTFWEWIEEIDLIIIDEVHHGLDGEGYNLLEEASAEFNIPIIGLTATPKENNHKTIEPAMSFDELVERKCLATPRIIPINTTDSSEIEIDNRGRVTPASLRSLGQCKTRNRQILKELFKTDWGKTILFACDIKHANTLFNEIKNTASHYLDEEFTTYVIHSTGISKEEIRRRVAEFKNNRGRCVLINVNMATTGMDIGDVKTLFMTRPTSSPILYSQMIGRGSRYKDDKKFFNVIEFTNNNIRKHIEENEIFSAQRFIDSENTSNRSYLRETLKIENVYYQSKFHYTPSNFKTYEIIVNNESVDLPYLPNQTFGIELELTKIGFDIYDEKEWRKEAEKIRQVLISILGEHLVCDEVEYEYDSILEYDVFNVVYDGSCGWEIVSPVLEGHTGFEILDTLLTTMHKRLANMGFIVNEDTGFHLHLGYKLPKNEKLQNLLYNIRYLEEYLALLVAPSRTVETDYDNLEGLTYYDESQSNFYCKSLRNLLSERDISNLYDEDDLYNILEEKLEDEIRYCSINFENLLNPDAPNALEIRLHSGTMNKAKILNWISLWMQLLENMKYPNDLIANTVIRKEIPVPNKESYSEFSEVITIFLKNLSASQIALLEERTDEVWNKWNEIEK